MEAYLQDWLSLLLRWLHMITGIAWIGASFYFNWLENHLEWQNASGAIAGDLWAVHGGGFYFLQKFAVAPKTLPPTLHWFKWEAYFTWLSGFALMCTVYYWNAALYMVDPGMADISAFQAVLLGVASMALSWVFYDLLCSSPLGKKATLSGLLIFGWFALLAWGLSELMSGRAAYIHVGAAIGTVMVANVFFVIIPSQKDLVTALVEGRSPDPAKGQNALTRSRHNNYFTLPVLFIMISNHNATTFGHGWNWLILVVISLAGVGIRHYFNVRHLPQHNRWILPVSLLLLLSLIVALAPEIQRAGPESKTASIAEEVVTYPDTAAVFPVIQTRCSVCHSATPTFQGISAPPLGIILDSPEHLEAAAIRVLQSTAITRTMPLGNVTAMTLEERELIKQWYAGQMRRP